ncbi:MAG: hypothetical protein AB1779_01445 [Candidatus Thermoplasmatota archaeon]
MNEEYLYDYSASPQALKRKKKVFRAYVAKILFLIFGFGPLEILCILALLILYPQTENKVAVVVALILAIAWLSIPISGWKLFFQVTYKYGCLDLKITHSYLELPEWNTISPTATKKYPIDYIEKIYWNKGSDHFLIIKSEEGMKETKSKNRHNMVYKWIIDDKKAFKEALRKTGKLIEDEKMEIGDWLKLMKGKRDKM